MADKKILVPMVAGAALGGVAGYLIGSVGGGRPLIKSFPATVPVGGTYSLYFEGFPPNTQLVSARNTTVVGGDVVTLGVTGPDGVLTISNITAVGPAGTYYIYAFDAPTGKYCAVLTLTVT